MPFIKTKVSCEIDKVQEEDIIGWGVNGMYIDRNIY